MSPDASGLLLRLALIQRPLVRGRGLVMERLKRGYSRKIVCLTGEGGSLTMMAVTDIFKSLRDKVTSLKMFLSYLASKND
jgi:hypothetical protein